jgi:4-nitrophenyl phosphatase
MKRYRGYLLDLDGTLYQGEQAIKGAQIFVGRLREQGIPHLYLTNNSSRTPEQVAAKLRRLGFPAEAEQVFTSAQSAARHLTGNGDRPRVYVIGEEGLRSALQDAGCRLVQEKADAVVVGIDRQFSYEKLKRACLAIRAGARFIGTNGDRVIPSEEGLLPGNGSLCAAITAATGVNPVFTGKPEPLIFQYALEILGTSPEETLVVGDNLETDIRGGRDAGMATLLVFTGVTAPEDYQSSAIRATHAVEDLRDWNFL